MHARESQRAQICCIDPVIKASVSTNADLPNATGSKANQVILRSILNLEPGLISFQKLQCTNYECTHKRQQYKS
jgi:hypothetical protein